MTSATIADTASCAICGAADNTLKRSLMGDSLYCDYDWKSKAARAPDNCCARAYQAEPPSKGAWAECETHGLVFMPKGKGCRACRGECGGGYAASESDGGTACPRRRRDWGCDGKIGALAKAARSASAYGRYVTIGHTKNMANGG